MFPIKIPCREAESSRLLLSLLVYLQSLHFQVFCKQKTESCFSNTHLSIKAVVSTEFKESLRRMCPDYKNRRLDRWEALITHRHNGPFFVHHNSNKTIFLSIWSHLVRVCIITSTEILLGIFFFRLLRAAQSGFTFSRKMNDTYNRNYFFSIVELWNSTTRNDEFFH